MENSFTDTSINKVFVCFFSVCICVCSCVHVCACSHVMLGPGCNGVKIQFNLSCQDRFVGLGFKVMAGKIQNM